MLDLGAERHAQGQPVPDLYEAVQRLKRRYGLHACLVRPLDAGALRRAAERDEVRELVRRFHDLPAEQRRQLPALRNGLAQLEVAAGDFDGARHGFAEVAEWAAESACRAEALANAFGAARQARAWAEALASLRGAAGLAPDRFAPFPFDRYEPLEFCAADDVWDGFRCRERSLGREVFVRAVRPDALEGGAEGFFRDLEALRDLGHAAAETVLAWGEAGEGGEGAFAAYAEPRGQTLDEVVSGGRPLAPDEWLRPALQVALALREAHGGGVLHRALGPRSLRLGREGDAWRVRLDGFGLAPRRDLVHRAAAAGHPGGDPGLAFAAPEQVGRLKGAGRFGPHTDVYRFGRTCLFALTGRPEAAPESLPEGWRLLIAACTAVKIAERPADFSAVLARLADLPGGAEALASVERELSAWSAADADREVAGTPNDPVPLVRRGNLRARRGEFDGAVADYTDALRLRPDAEVYRARGRARAGQGDGAGAVEDFSEALRGNPEDAAALRERGAAHARLGNHERAAADYGAALGHDPHDLAALFGRANAYYLSGAHDLALADYDAVLRREPRHLGAFGMRGLCHAVRGDHARALADFGQVLRLDPDSVQAYADRARSHASLGDFERALADCAEALRRAPSAALLSDRGMVNAARGDHEAAAADHTAALELDPGNFAALVRRGDALCALGRVEEGLADYDRAAESGPSSPVAPHRRARARAGSGDSERALADLEEAVRRDPGYVPALVERGGLLCGLGRHAEALADFDAVLRVAPEPAAYAGRGHAYSVLGDFARALADFGEALRLAPSPAVFNDRGNARRRLGDLAGAARDYTDALRTAPDLALTLHNRGNTLADLGDFAGAAADFTALLRLDPRDARALHNRGRVHALAGDYARAVADNLAALELNADDALALNNLAWLWATAEDPALRDTAKALEYSLRSCELTGWNDAGQLDTLAVTYAACGRFDEAVRWQERALELAAPGLKDEFRSRLESYRAGRPHRPAGG